MASLPQKQIPVEFSLFRGLKNRGKERPVMDTVPRGSELRDPRTVFPGDS